MSETYTLQIHHPSKYDYHITVPELDITTQSTVNLDSALMLASRAIEKHLKTRQLVLVFQDSTVLEEQTALSILEVAKQGIAPHCERKEVHLVFDLSQPLTREQARWLDAMDGKLFHRYFTKDEVEVSLDELKEKA